MNWHWLVAYLFGGVFAGNVVPHLVAGSLGQAFQSPFAKPPGEGLSSSIVNVLWGFFNAVMAYLLLVRVGTFDLHATSHVVAFGAGVLMICLNHANHFGKFHGGKTASRA